MEMAVPQRMKLLTLRRASTPCSKARCLPELLAQTIPCGQRTRGVTTTRARARSSRTSRTNWRVPNYGKSLSRGKRLPSCCDQKRNPAGGTHTHRHLQGRSFSTLGIHPCRRTNRDRARSAGRCSKLSCSITCTRPKETITRVTASRSLPFLNFQRLLCRRRCTCSSSSSTTTTTTTANTGRGADAPPLEDVLPMYVAMWQLQPFHSARVGAALLGASA
mmetsp:Transcript_13808/g.50285  ORF Transcript_13808/g.50285 Transcript_13808/m.50285 type:complete len:219 (-) Transcript_13808:64-720(-)